MWFFGANRADPQGLCGVSHFLSVNVLERPRRFAAASRSTPTGQPFRSLYVRGEFVGGCDIMREMYEDGELQKVA
jgi:monothiol glutaredoxin